MLLFVFALVACGGGSQSPESGSGESRSSERQDSGGRAERAEKTAEKGAGQDTTTARMETTGPDEGTVAEEAKSEPQKSRRSGPVPSDALAAGATDSTGGPLARGRMVSYYGHPLSGAMGALGQLELVEEKDLPPKVLVIHQFETGMIQNKDMLRPVPNVEMVLHADGFGTPQQKFEKYDLLVRDEPIQYGGFKLFYDQDTPLLTPKQVLDRLEPKPAVISYQ